MKYNQFCPVSKAAEIVGERWSLLILRELLMGGRRFSELQRGLGFISPALLTTRLKQFEGHGLIVRRQIKGGRGYEYFPTPACEQLLPVIIALGEWGLCWARENVSEDFDPEMLLLYLERSIDPKNLPGNSTIIRFEFRDLDRQNLWWIVVEGENVDVCLNDPGREVDVWFTTTLQAMSDVWMGDRTYKDARASGELDVQGLPALTRNVSSWLTPSVFAASPRAA